MKAFVLVLGLIALAFASEHDIPAGHSLVLAEIPESQLVGLKFTHAKKNNGAVKVWARCTDEYLVSISNRSDAPLKVAAFRGQQYTLKYGCYGCKPRIETVSKLMQADQDLVLALK